MKYQTEMTFPVELTFEVLPALLVEDTELPAQLDITKVLLTIVGPSGKPRQVDITKSFSEEQIMLLEDEIVEHYDENPAAL
jgi:hypothetical protein